jgi:hypothetical protein
MKSKVLRFGLLDALVRVRVVIGILKIHQQRRAIPSPLFFTEVAR